MRSSLVVFALILASCNQPAVESNTDEDVDLSESEEVGERAESALGEGSEESSSVVDAEEVSAEPQEMAAASAATTGGYYVCQFPGSPRPERSCESCPSGSTMISYNPNPIPECSGNKGHNAPNIAKSEGCDVLYSIKEMGWNGGHKTNYCKSRGYEFISRPGSSYNTGNYCFLGVRTQCAKDIG